jgi:hypothetical protein
VSDYGSPTPPQQRYGQVGVPPPPNYLVWSILTTIFCCLPLGIASIVFSARVNTKWEAGNFAGAQEASDKAKKFALWGTLSGAALIFASPVLIFYAGSIIGQLNGE